jgi:hypothetical protein
MLHNKATELIAKHDRVGFDMYNGIANMKTLWLKYCKQYEPRLCSLVPDHRVTPRTNPEDESTDIMIPGFFVKPAGKGKHKLGPLKVSLQFLENHKMLYLDLHSDIGKMEYAQQSEA